MNQAEPDRIRILLIDDHNVVRVGLRMVIEQQGHLRVVAEAGNRAEAIAAAAATDPDIILLDIDLHGEDALDIMPQLKTVAANARIIVITGSHDSGDHRRAVRLGAQGVVLKNRDIETVTRAIERVYAGESWFEPSLLSHMLNERDTSKHLLLTPREREVVEAVCRGLRNQDIASELIVSEATVRHHLTAIFTKLGVKDRVELVIYAYTHGLVAPPK